MGDDDDQGSSHGGWLGSRAARRAAAHNAPKRSGAYYRELFHFASDPIYCVDAETLTFIDLNQTACDTLGYERHELVGLPVSHVDTAGPEELERYVAHLESQGHGMLRSRHRRRDGSELPVEVHSQRRQWNGRTVYDCVARDLTERVAVEEARRVTEAAFEAAGRMAQVGAWTLDLRTGEVFFSAEVCRIYGLSEGCFLAAEEGILFYPEDVRPTITEAVERAIADGSEYDLEIAFVNKQGERRWVRTIGQAHRDESGNPVRLFGTLQDITTHHVAKLVAEAQSAIRLRASALTADDDLSTVVATFCSYLSTLRVPAASCVVLVSAGEPQVYRYTSVRQGHWRREDGGRDVPDGAGPGAEGDILCETGDLRLWVAAAQASRFSGADRAAVQCLVREMAEASDRLAERKAALARELQLQQARRMESVGRLAGGIAHDFNNLLAVIVGTCELARDNGQPPTLEDLTTIEQAALSAQELTRQLLAFSRQQVLRPRVVSVNETVARLARMLRRVLDERVVVVVRAEAEHDAVFVDPGRVEQVVMNLAVNARDAMPDGGRLTIETTNVIWEHDTAERPPHCDPGRYVRLSIADTGSGIPEEVLPRIFEPFFTTKGAGAGTGLGLAMVHGTVTQSGGHIAVRSNARDGTSFDIYLPHSTRAPVRGSSDGPVATSGPGGGEAVLVVEDQEGVRTMVATMLRKAGYRVDSLCCCEALHRWLAEGTGAVDLVVTDVVLTDGTGTDVARAVRGRLGPVPVVFMSGYASGELFDQAMAVDHSAFLEKPFGREALLAQVRQSLARRTQRQT